MKAFMGFEVNIAVKVYTLMSAFIHPVMLKVLM